jgi:hypothetical protein
LREAPKARERDEKPDKDEKRVRWLTHAMVELLIIPWATFIPNFDVSITSGRETTEFHGQNDRGFDIARVSADSRINKCWRPQQ